MLLFSCFVLKSQDFFFVGMYTEDILKQSLSEMSIVIFYLFYSSDENSDLMDRLRWVHLGYHFDYNVVDYKPERYYDFPSDLAGMTQHIANAIGYPDYSPEAGIVNYYPLGGSMGGHTDHYESDLSWPLISLSFGQTAIFLIGGATRDIRPVGK